MIEKVYASLIIKDKKKFSEVPLEIKEKVRLELIKVGREDLIMEESE